VFVNSRLFRFGSNRDFRLQEEECARLSLSLSLSLLTSRSNAAEFHCSSLPGYPDFNFLLSPSFSNLMVN